MRTTRLAHRRRPFRATLGPDSSFWLALGLVIVFAAAGLPIALCWRAAGPWVYGSPSMRRLLVVVQVLAASSAVAHIKLTDPPSWQVTDSYGSPQKTAPCGEAGTASNVVTTVVAGSQLTVSWTDTIYHSGHYRISIAQDRSQLVTPVSSGANCDSAVIDANPVLPTIVDGLYPHTTGTTGMTRSYTFTVPMMSCDNCTLQLMQFMAQHSTPCFYYQCAALRIVMPDAGMGMDAGVDAGTGIDAGRMTDAGTMSGTDAGAMNGTDAGPGAPDGGMDPTMATGCGCSGAAGALSWVGLAFAWALQRRRR